MSGVSQPDPELLSQKTCKCPGCGILHDVEDHWYESFNVMPRVYCEHCSLRAKKNAERKILRWDK